MSEKRVIEINCMNDTGVINRITSIFHARGISIDSLVSCQTEKENHFTIFIELTYDWKKVVYMIRLLEKLVDITSVKDITDEVQLDKELTLLKIKYHDLNQCLRTLEAFDIASFKNIDRHIFIEYSESKTKTDSLIDSLNEVGVVTYLKSGRVFMR